MGNTALLATMAAALVASVALINADYSVLSTADSQTRDEQNVLAERAATSAFEMAASQLRRDFQTWRTGYAPTSYLGGTFAAEVGGPATGPIRIQARGVNADTVSVAITGWMSRLAAASGALTIDADTASVSLRGANVVVSGVDHRATTWKNADMGEGNGLAEPVIGLLASQSGSHYAVNQALGTGANAARVRGINGNGDVGLGGLPTDFATLLGEAVGFRTRTLAGDQTISATYGTPEAPAVVQVTGDVTFTGGGGYGLLYVQGSFEASGDFAWEGLVIADGENQMDFKLSGNASIRGAAYVSHTATIDRNVAIGNTSTKPYTLWAPDDETGHLRFYSFGDEDGDGVADYSHGIEGDLRGWTAPSPNNGDYADSEALAFGPDGTLYIVDNPVQNGGKNVSRLYKISPDQLDGNPATPVMVAEIGRTYRDLTTNVNNADEVHGLVFYQGKLYGIGARNETVYDLSLTNGRANSVRTFTAYHRGGGTDQLDARALTADGDGNVYVSSVQHSGTRIYKFDSFPNGNAREVLRVDETVSGIGFHPDGYLYGYDRGAGKIYRMDVELGTSEVMMDAVSGDIEDMALFYAGEMAAMGLNEAPQFSKFNEIQGAGSRSQTVSWPSIGTVTVKTSLQAEYSDRYWIPAYKSMVKGTTLQDFLSTATNGGSTFDITGNKIGDGAPIRMEYTGPVAFPMLEFLPGSGAPNSWETIELEFNQPLSRQALRLYIADSEWFDVHIVPTDVNGNTVDFSDWTKETSVDVVGGDDGARTTLGLATRYSNAVTLSDAGPAFRNSFQDSETIIDEILIPNASAIRSIKIYTKSANGNYRDRMAIGLTTPESIFQEAGSLTVDMRDNASVRYSSEAIGKLAVRLPTIASASWFETFDRFAEAEVDRMFGLDRRVKRGEARPRGPVVPGDTASGGSGGQGGGVDTGGTGNASVFVCHKAGKSRSSLSIDLLSLAVHLAHGDTQGQCSSGSGGSGSGGKGSGGKGSGGKGSGGKGSGGRSGG